MFRRKRTPPIRDESWDEERHGPRVLIENRDGALSWAIGNELRQAGFRVAACDGPNPDADISCSLTSEGHCALAEQADAVVSDIRAADGGAELITALRELDPSKPILRQCTEQSERRDASFLNGVTIVRYPTLDDELVDAVDAAVRDGIGG